MIIYGTFTRYTSGKPGFDNVVELQNDQKQDFYELRNSLTKGTSDGSVAAATYVVIDPSTGIVATANNDVDLIFPGGMTLVAVAQVADPKTLIGQIMAADGTFSAPPPPPVTSVTRTQGLIQLHRAGLYDQYQSAVAAADPETQIWAQNAPTWEIDNSNLLKLAATLSLSESQIQALFNAGAQIA